MRRHSFICCRCAAKSESTDGLVSGQTRTTLRTLSTTPAGQNLDPLADRSTISKSRAAEILVRFPVSWSLYLDGTYMRYRDKGLADIQCKVSQVHKGTCLPRTYPSDKLEGVKQRHAVSGGDLGNRSIPRPQFVFHGALSLRVAAAACCMYIICLLSLAPPPPPS